MSRIAVNKLANRLKTKEINVDSLIDTSLRSLKPASVLPSVRDNGAPLEVGDIVTSLVDGKIYSWKGTVWEPSTQQLEERLSTTKGGNLSGWEREALTKKIENVGEALSAQPVNIWEFSHLVTSKPTPSNPSTWDWSPALMAALTSGKSVRTVPNQTYRVADIYLANGMELIACKSSTFVPVAGGVTMFRTVSNTGIARNFTLEGVNVKNVDLVSGVTVFDLPEARRNVHLNRLFIDGMGKQYGWIGVSLPKLNWNTRISNVESLYCGIGFKLRNAAAVIDMPGCIAYGCGTGFDIRYIAADDIDIMNQIHLHTGVCQSNDTGVFLRNTSNVVLDCMHFENNTTDIDMDGDKNVRILYPEFTGGNTGLKSVGIKARNTTGVFIQKLSFNGKRQLGFFDVDASNVMFNADIDQRLDAPLINNDLFSYIGNISGIRFAPNFSNFRSFSGTEINCNQIIQSWYRTVQDGGAVITATNPREGAELLVVLRVANTYTSGAISVMGKTIDVSGGTTIRAKNNTLVLFYKADLGGWVVRSESGWRA